MVDCSFTLLQHHPTLNTLQLKRTLCFDCHLHTKMASGHPPPLPLPLCTAHLAAAALHDLSAACRLND